MTYLLYVEEGPACDYSIGCGKKLIPLDTDDLNEARAKAIAKVRAHKFLSAKIVGLVEVLDAQALYAAAEIEAKEAAERKRRADEEARERATLAELQAKYGTDGGRPLPKPPAPMKMLRPQPLPPRIVSRKVQVDNGLPVFQYRVVQDEQVHSEWVDYAEAQRVLQEKQGAV